MAAPKDPCLVTESSPSVVYLPSARLPRGEDLPYSDGIPMESERHVKQATLLAETLEHAWADRKDFYVARDMFVYFSELQCKRNDFRGPDVFVVMNTVRKERKSWVVWEEGGKGPDVVIELLSESTEAEDRGRKMGIYARELRVSEYYLFDPFTGKLEGYEPYARERRFRRRKLEGSGRLWSEKLGLYLGTVLCSFQGVRAKWLRWFDASGCLLPTFEEEHKAEAKRAEAETKRAEAEAKRADAEAKRARAQAKKATAALSRLRAAAQRMAASGLSVRQIESLLGMTASELGL